MYLFVNGELFYNSSNITPIDLRTFSACWATSSSCLYPTASKTAAFHPSSFNPNFSLIGSASKPSIGVLSIFNSAQALRAVDNAIYVCLADQWNNTSGDFTLRLRFTVFP